MKNIRVLFYDADDKTIIEHESIPDGEVTLSGSNEELYNDIFLRVDQFRIGSQRYKVESRCFSLEDDKLILIVSKL